MLNFVGLNSRCGSCLGYSENFYTLHSELFCIYSISFLNSVHNTTSTLQFAHVIVYTYTITCRNRWEYSINCLYQYCTIESNTYTGSSFLTSTDISLILSRARVDAFLNPLMMICGWTLSSTNDLQFFNTSPAISTTEVVPSPTWEHSAKSTIVHNQNTVLQEKYVNSNFSKSGYT